MKKNKICLALCEARHAMPDCVTGSIFGNTVDPLDLDGLYFQAKKALKGIDKLDLYVTGLTVALVEVINFCRCNDISLTIWHYNREADNYYPQEVD